MTDRPPLVVLAIDVGDPRLCTRWTREGRLPTLAALMARGCWGTIGGPEQIAEFGSWPSLFSGLSRVRHGLYDRRRQLKPGTYDLQLVDSHAAAAPSFWSYLRSHATSVAIMDAPESPVVPGLVGVQVADWATHQSDVARRSLSAEPSVLTDEIRRDFGIPAWLPEFVPHSTLADDQALHASALEQVAKRGTLYRRLLARGRFNLVVAGFCEAHFTAHRLWKYHTHADESHPLRHGLREIYEAIDREIGQMVEPLAGANVVVVSTYGMKSQYPMTGLVESFCTELGYQVPVRGAPSFDPLAIARRVIPQAWRVALSERLSRGAQERLIAERLRNTTDWSRTTAFAIPTLNPALLRVNLRGREPRGIVAPGEYEGVLDRLESDLRQLVDPQSGQPAVESIVRTASHFHCGPPDVLPDLIAEWREADVFMDRVVHPDAVLTQSRQWYHRDSWHAFDGFVVAAGPTIRAHGDIGAVDTLDLAPTFLALLGESAPDAMKGKVAEGWV